MLISLAPEGILAMVLSPIGGCVTLGDHFNIYIAITECGEHLASDANGLLKLKTNQAENCHVVDHINRTVLFELLDRIL